MFENSGQSLLFYIGQTVLGIGCLVLYILVLRTTFLFVLKTLLVILRIISELF